jgi:hypothetical protein
MAVTELDYSDGPEGGHVTIRMGALNDVSNVYQITGAYLMRSFSQRENAVTYTVLVEGSSDLTNWYTVLTHTNAATSVGTVIQHPAKFIRFRYTAQGGASYIELNTGWGGR